jgi:hypothetical protein
MSYHILYNTLKIDKYIVQEILNFIDLPNKIYTERCFEDIGNGIYDYTYHKKHILPYDVYYKAVYSDCINNLDEEEDSDED